MMMMTVPLFQTHIHHAPCSGNAGVRGTHRGVAIIASANPFRLRPQTPCLPPSPPTNYILLLWERCSIQFSMSVLRMRLTPYIVDRPQFRYHYEMFEDHRSLSRCPYYNVSRVGSSTPTGRLTGRTPTFRSPWVSRGRVSLI